jgi:DNA adenine methylase
VGVGGKIRRPPLRYHGSKWRMGDWIIGYFPPHDAYVEAYGGGAAVLLQKKRSYIEVYNDLDGEVVNFFRVLREQPDELARLIKFTPWATAEWELSQEDDPDPLEMARRFYARAWMSIAGPTAQWRTGWRRQKILTKENGKRRMTPAALTFMQTDHLYQVAERLRGVQIECDEALEVVEVYDSPDTLYYLDPPYPAITRGRWYKAAYRHEMTDDQHREMAARARALEGMVMISGYRCELYDELFGDWKRVEKRVRTQRASTAVESLWLSPNLVARWQTMLPLFNHAVS